MDPTALRGGRGLWLGFRAPFRGIGTIASRPGLWPFAAVPTLLLGLFVTRGAALAQRAYGGILARATEALGDGAFAGAGLWVVRAVVILLLGVAVLLAAVVLVPPASAPFMDAIAERVDARKQLAESLAAQIA